jgi:xylan 1,4-beta-xylosidase
MTEPITLRFDAPGSEYVPYWRTCVGAGRAGEGLRAAFQQHLEMVQRDMPFSYLRVHGIFHEDMMVYREEAGEPVLNWQYVDMLYDHWLSVGIRPFVEIGFMPYDLASGDQTVFWWRGNVTPPRDWDRWEWLVGEFIRHLAARYGLAEIRQWYFEVWNEPDLAVFWKDADFGAYLELYRRTARAVKAVDPRLRVGGPASAGASDKPGTPSWGKEFLAACQSEQLPLDFFSTHPYPTVHTVDLTGKAEMTWGGPDRLLTDLAGARDTLVLGGYPDIERHYTEWSSSPSPRDRTHDTAFMAPFIVRNCWLGRGFTNSLSFWTVSDIFEETRLGDAPFHGGFGLINSQGLQKPSYHGYRILSRLGTTELASGDSYAATRRDDGSLAVAVWNYCHYRDSAQYTRQPGTDVYEQFEPGSAKRFELVIADVDGHVRVQATRVDREHGSVYDAWLSMGAPGHMLPADVAALRQAAEPDVTVTRVSASDGRVELPVHVEPHGVTLLEISRERR